MWSNRPYTFDRVVRIFFSTVVACIALFFVYKLRHVLLPFCAACLIAYIIEPLVKWNQKWLKIKSHPWAVVITTFDGLAIAAVMCIIAIPIIEKEFSHLAMLLHNYMKDVNPNLGAMPNLFIDFTHTHFDVDKIIEEIEKINIAQGAETIWRDFTSGLDKLLGILGWLVVVVYVIFILLDFDKYEAGIKRLVPNKYKHIVGELSHDLSWTMKRYFRNQALISFITGCCYMIGFSIVGLPMAVVIGLLNMILFMVPYLVYISVIPVILMCMLKAMEGGGDFWIIFLECVAVYAVVEAFADMVLTPKIMGKALGMNPAIILLSLSVWGTLLGLLGMIIALPATTIILKWSDIWLTNWRNSVDGIAPNSLPPPDE